MMQYKQKRLNGKIVSYEKYLMYSINYLVSEYILKPDKKIENEIVKKWNELKNIHKNN